jgi:hypothetical protein
VQREGRHERWDDADRLDEAARAEELAAEKTRTLVSNEEVKTMRIFKPTTAPKSAMITVSGMNTAVCGSAKRGCPESDHGFHHGNSWYFRIDIRNASAHG